jgi:DDE_Tnp_1-associated
MNLAVSNPAVGAPSASDEFALLMTALAQVADFRKPQGKHHPLPGVLALVVLGLMADCRSLSAIRRFGRCHPEVLPTLD